MRNKVGCCILSGRRVFMVLSEFTTGPREGEPDRLGLPYYEAWRVTLLLVDGSTTDVTVHEDYLEEIEGRLPELWRNALEAHAYERQNWEEAGARPFTPDQTEKAYRDSESLINNVPLGVVKKERWRDVNG